MTSVKEIYEYINSFAPKTLRAITYSWLSMRPEQL